MKLVIEPNSQVRPVDITVTMRTFVKAADELRTEGQDWELSYPVLGGPGRQVLEVSCAATGEHDGIIRYPTVMIDVQPKLPTQG